MMKLAALTRRILPALFGIALFANANANEEIIFKNFEPIPGKHFSTPAEFSDGTIISSNYDLTDLLTGTIFLDPGDTENPTAVCVASGTTTVVLDENGIGTLAVEDIDAGSTDNIAIASMELSQTSFNCELTGTQPVILIVTDSNGNTASCTTDVEVVDVSPPILSVNDTLNLFLDATGSIELTQALFSDGASDNCGIASFSINPGTLNCDNINSGKPLTDDVIISEYVEGSGSNQYIELYNGSSAPANMSKFILYLIKDGSDSITVSDNLGYLGIMEPGEVVVLKNQNATLYTGQAYSSPAVDFDGNDFLLLSKQSLEGYSDGFGVRFENPDSGWTYNGINTMNHTLRRKISIYDGNHEVLANTFLSEWDQFDMDDVSDLGSNTYQTEGTQVDISVIDNSGNSASTTVWVNLADTIAPVLTSVPGDIEITATSNQEGYLHWSEPTATDNCGVTINVDSQNHYPYFVGDTVITVSAIDPSGNSVYTTFTATVNPLPLQMYLISDHDSTLCFNQPTRINAAISGGTAPYTFIWDGVASDGFDSNVTTPGLHILQIVDAAGETVSDSITLYQNPEITYNVNYINPSCDTCSDGIIYIDSLAGGTPPYQYAWADSSYDILLINQDTLSDLSYYQYHFLVWDSLQCPVLDTLAFEPEDNIPPTANCGTANLVLDANGNANLIPADLDNGSSDNSGNLSFDATPTSFSCSDLGTNDVILTVSDAAGNTATCTGTVTVTDSMPPVVLVKDTLYVTIDGGALFELAPSDVDLGSYDNCNLYNYTVSPQFMTCANVITNPPLSSDLIISEYVEGTGNNKYIEIYNGTGAPVDLSNYELRLYSNGASTPNSSAGLGNAGTLANMETAVFRNTSAAIYSGTSYVNSAINFNGNDAIALFNLNSNENTDIFGVIGQDPGSAWESNGLSTKDFTLTRKRSVSTGNTNPVNVGFLSEWDQKNVNDVAGLGSHSFALQGTEVTATLTDNSGNVATGITIVVAIDEVAPIFTSGFADVHVTSDPATCSATAYWPEPGVFDNCDLTVTSDHVSGESFSIGTTPVTYTATDPSGNSSTLTFNIIVSPAPLFLDIIPGQELGCHDTPGPITVFANGGCLPYTYTWDAVAGGNDTELVGPGLHEVMVTDGNENTSTIQFYLENPSAVELAMASTNPSCSAANGEVSVDVIGGTAPYSIEWSGDASGTGNILSNLEGGTYIATATDSRGCSSSESVTLDGSDTTVPIAICENLTVYLDSNGTATMSAFDIDGGSSDNCGDVTLSANQTTFSCTDIGANEVTLLVTDESGNIASCNATVTVIDNQIPVISGMPADITATADPSTCAAVVTWTEPEATDNCNVTLSADYASGDSFGNGETTVTYTATDLFGNSIAQSFTVTVSPEELTLDFDPENYIHCHGGTSDLVAHVSGGCEPYAYTWDGVPGTDTQTLSTGVHDILVTDANGATYSLLFYMYEPDELVLSLSATNPNCSSTPTGQITASITGGLTPYTVVWSGDATGTGTTLTNLGSGTYTATVTDLAGCSTTQTVTLVTEDTTPPTAICANTTLYLDQNGEATLTAADIDGGSSDLCGAVSIQAYPTTFSCSNTGENEVYLSVNDQNGNSSACAATVTVLDTVAPVISTQDIEVSLDLTGFAMVQAVDIDSGTSDNCGIGSIEITSGQVQYGCEDTGNTFAVTLTATDIYGNTSSSVAQVSVVAGADDEDGDGIGDSCDICFGDNSYGDADGDGICDAPQWCPGAYDILDPSLACDYQMNTPPNGFQANSGGIYCIAGPYNGGMIYVTNGSTVRLSGTGTVKVQVASNSALEVEDGGNVTFTSLYLGWNCRGLVVHSGATANFDAFSNTEPVVNCGVVNASSFKIGYNGIFTNYGTLNVSGANSNNNIGGFLTNQGEINITGKLTLGYNGNIVNHCTINIGKDFIVGRFVNNHEFINVTGLTNISYNGVVSLFDGAMYQTGSTRISGKYAGYGASSLVKVLTNTNAMWTARIQGELYFCDEDGIESSPNYSNLFQGNALESCNLTIDVTDCNPVGNVATPSAMTTGGEFSDGILNLEYSGDELGNEQIALAVQNAEVEDAVHIFPNPTTGKALIEFTPKNSGDVTITIFNIRGELLKTSMPAGQVAGQPFVANLDLTAYENGVYFIRITDDIRTVTRKLVVAR